MTTKSPIASVKLREVIGGEQFSQRREVFDKYDTVFLPPPSPPSLAMAAAPPPVITSNHGKTTTNFKRNAPAYSSMRESRTEDRNIEFRARKYSDNLTSDLNQSDDVDYRLSSRLSVTERTRKMRRDFLNSNLHEPSQESPFARSGVRASMPVGSGLPSPARYKVENLNLYKFPFAEPYATPPPTRRVVLDLGPIQLNGDKENTEVRPKYNHQSLPNNNLSPKVDHQKMFEDLLQRYSPERKPVDWKIPPTRPRVVGSVPKSTSSVADSLDSGDKKVFEETINKSADDDVFVKKDTAENKETAIEAQKIAETNEKEERSLSQPGPSTAGAKQNGPEAITTEDNNNKRESKENDSQSSLTELEEKNDKVPELSTLQRENTPKRASLEKYTDMSIPDLIDKMIEDGEDLESHRKGAKKVKRKRSFLDKLLGRKKDK